MFPFDFFFENDKLQIAVYTDLCPIGFDERHFLAQALFLVDRLGENQLRYALHESPRLDRREYRVLGTLEEIRSRLLDRDSLPIDA